MTKKPSKETKLEEYNEESTPFDTVIRTLLKAKPKHKTKEKKQKTNKD